MELIWDPLPFGCTETIFFTAAPTYAGPIHTHQWQNCSLAHTAVFLSTPHWLLLSHLKPTKVYGLAWDVLLDSHCSCTHQLKQVFRAASLDALVCAGGLYPQEGNEMQIFSNQCRFLATSTDFSNQNLDKWFSELLDTDSLLLEMA